MFSYEYSKSFRDSFSYRTTLVTAFELSFSIRQEFKKKKVSGEITFALNSLFHVQIQEPASRSTTTRAFVFFAKFNFIITKHLKQQVDDDLSACMDERSPCGLSITGNIKIYQCHVIKENDFTTPNAKVPNGLLSRSCFYCPNLITTAPLYIEMKKFVKVT